MLMDESEVIAAKFRFVFPEAPDRSGPDGNARRPSMVADQHGALAEINQTQDYSELTRISPPGMSEATSLLAAAVQEMRSIYRVEEDRIVLGGFSWAR